MEKTNPTSTSDDKSSSEPFIWKKKLINQGLSDASNEQMKLITENTIKKNKVKLAFYF